MIVGKQVEAKEWNDLPKVTWLMAGTSEQQEFLISNAVIAMAVIVT
jgi:hypothetical protein